MILINKSRKMKPYKLIVEKLERSSEKFITSKELKDYSKRLSVNASIVVKYLVRHKHISRIFNGIFYIYSIEERKLGKSEVAFYEILKEALKIKGVKNWYFGLETALKLNNLTHEYFTVDYIINDTLFRQKSISIMGRKVKFYKLTKKMFCFGIKKDKINYSDPEKTLLDLLHLKHYNLLEFKEAAEKSHTENMVKYSKMYRKEVRLATEGIKNT